MRQQHLSASPSLQAGRPSPVILISSPPFRKEHVNGCRTVLPIASVKRTDDSGLLPYFMGRRETGHKPCVVLFIISQSFHKHLSTFVYLLANPEQLLPRAAQSRSSRDPHVQRSLEVFTSRLAARFRFWISHGQGFWNGSYLSAGEGTCRERYRRTCKDLFMVVEYEKGE